MGGDKSKKEKKSKKSKKSKSEHSLDNDNPLGKKKSSHHHQRRKSRQSLPGDSTEVNLFPSDDDSQMPHAIEHHATDDESQTQSEPPPLPPLELGPSEPTSPGPEPPQRTASSKHSHTSKHASAQEYKSVTYSDTPDNNANTPDRYTDTSDRQTNKPDRSSNNRAVVQTKWYRCNCQHVCMMYNETMDRLMYLTGGNLVYIVVGLVLVGFMLRSSFAGVDSPASASSRPRESDPFEKDLFCSSTQSNHWRDRWYRR